MDIDTWPVAPGKAAEETRTVFGVLQGLALRNRTNYICARAGWTINLLFKEGDTLPVRERAWKVFDALCEAIDPALLVYWHGGAPVPLTSNTAQKKLAEKRQKSTENPHGYAMNFTMASGNSKPPEDWENNAQDFYIKFRIGNNEGLWMHDPHKTGIGPSMSYIRIALPVSWILQQPPERGPAALTSRLVELMQPFWCTAGWGIVPAVEERNIDSSSGQQVLYPYLKRFPGIEAISQLALMDHQFNNAMYSVNWLSYVSDELMQKMGGREEVRRLAKLSPYLGIGDIGNCLGIRAGDFPGLGDTERGFKMPGFGAAARLLKPLRAASAWNNFIGSPPDGNSDKEQWQLDCDAYLSRFDGY